MGIFGVCPRYCEKLWHGDDTLKVGRTPIILTQRKEHVTRLSSLIKNQTDAHVITLISEESIMRLDSRELEAELEAMVK